METSPTRADSRDAGKLLPAEASVPAGTPALAGSTLQNQLPTTRECARPAPAPPSLLFRPPSYVDRIDLAQLFPKAQPLEVELGSGDGSFLVEWARRHPEHNFLGLERLLGRIRKLDRKGHRAGLTNLRGIRLEASYFMEYLLPPASVQALHVYFPDPWPKRKHRKHRLVNSQFTETAVKILAPGGAVFLRTDDADYFAQMESVFEANPSFAAVETPPELAEVVTDFEREFNAHGVATLRATYRLEASL
jgi:tRNA (guanine-N7-)-methyltransferase